MPLTAAIREAQREAKALRVSMVVIEINGSYSPARREWWDSLSDDHPIWNLVPFHWGDVGPSGDVQSEW